MHFIPTDLSVTTGRTERELIVNIHGIAIDDRALVAAIVEGIEAHLPRPLRDDRRPEGCE
jgi:hypothetical protein